MDFNDILDDNEKQALIAFNAQETMKQAVQKVLLAGLYENGTLKGGKAAHPTRNGALSLVLSNPSASNEELGADLRAMAEGIRVVENAFKKISEFKLPEKADNKPNPAR